ncbi:MAG: aspartyl/glutamyl-tRNA amidotransferase subunit A, partial [Bacteroidota bacterium]|nr:aspartyl/glutamyl-tRNA amidotransferase subunit A [Bacteroidota bacterium]
MFDFSSIEQYQTQLHQGELTCVQVVQYFLEKIKTTKYLNAFIEVFADEALLRAAELDNKRKNNQLTGKLHGVIVGLKDVICYKDHKISAASNILKNFTSIYSATAVERILEQDGIIIGNLNCDEFAMGSTNENSAYGKVLNALDETKVPGGSSGGPAVAVQAGLCMVSLGSDTGGSVRQPADFCGIVGLKPTYGRVSRYGLIAYASSFDQIGIFGKNIADVARTLEVISGPDEFDSTVSHKPFEESFFKFNTNPSQKYRFAYFPEALNHPSLDPEISTSIKELISKLKIDGQNVEEVHFEYLDYIVPAYYVLTTAEASSNLSRYDGIKYGYSSADHKGELTEYYFRTRSEGFGKEVKR